jgi:hypothetical protein
MWRPRGPQRKFVAAGLPVVSATAVALLATAGAASAAVPGTGVTPATSQALSAQPMAAFARPNTTQATAPATLSGETLGAAFVPNNLTITASGCNPNGNSWFTYTMSGSASGPYTGTFTETGIVDLSAETQTFPVGTAPGPAGSVVGALAHFTINASNGTVQGLSYAPPARGLYDTPGNNFADCLPAGGVTRSPAQHIYEAGANINYAATIQPAGSRSWYVDNGTSNLLIDEENGFVYPTGPGTITQDFLYEDFTSNGSSTTPL